MPLRTSGVAAGGLTVIFRQPQHAVAGMHPRWNTGLMFPFGACEAHIVSVTRLFFPKILVIARIFLGKGTGIA
jgi:hypothetical protein